MDNMFLMKRKPKNFIAHITRKRIRQNKNLILAILGDTGSGKSYAAVSLAEEIDPTFNADRIVFSVRDFMALLNSGKLKKGNVIILDEAGTSAAMGSREWYSITNKVMNYVLQTFRKDNIIVIFTTPDNTFLDKQVRSLLHMILVTEKIDFKKEMCYVKIFCIQNNPLYKEPYKKKPRIKIPGQPIFKLNYFGIKKPSKELTKQYEVKKNLFLKQYNRQIYAQLEEFEGKTSNKEPGEKVVYKLTELEDKARDYLRQGHNITSTALLMKRDKSQISQIKKNILKKGWEI